jgi:uncharacterized protein YgiM (DUF1202 family)
MPRTNLRVLILLVLFLLFAVAPVLAAPTLDITLSHVGNAGAGNIDFSTNSVDGTVTVAIRNISPSEATVGDITATVTLNGGLVFGALVNSTPGNLFTCSGTTTVTCITAGGSIPANSTETITFTVVAPATPTTSAVTNTVLVTGGSAPDASATDPDFFNVIAATVDLVITGITHVGTFGQHFVVNSNTGTVTVTLQNNGTDATSGVSNLSIVLNGGLSFGAQSSGALFNNCAGTNVVNCSTPASIGPGDGDIITFTVIAPGSPNGGPFTNSASVIGGGDNSLDTKTDLVSFSIIIAGTLTPTGSTTPTPSPTFPFTPTPAPTSTPTLIPNPPTRTPIPRSPNAGLALGACPRSNVVVVVDRDGVNVRLLPAIGAEVIAFVNAGFTANVITRSPDSEWVEVEINGQLGWIGTAVLAIIQGDLASAPVSDPRTIPYCGFENPRAGTTSVTSATTGRLAQSGLRVRGGPSRAYPVLANAPRYTVFSLLGRSSNSLWLQVNFEGTLGWVATQFVELQQGVGSIEALPIDGIVADTVPVSDPTLDSFNDVVRLMLARVELAQPSLDAIRGIWTSIALGQSVQCANFPARPNDIQISNAVLAPFYSTLFPLNTDFNSAMGSLRAAIDQFIDLCNQRLPTSGLAGSPLVQQALDAVNAADALFGSLRQRLNALLPQDQELSDDNCLFTFQNRSQIVPRLRVNQAQVFRMTRRNFILGFCFDGATGQSLRLQALRVNGNAEPRLTVSSFDNPTNFIGTTNMTNSVTDVTIGPILITQTGRYIMIMADLDGAPGADLDSEIALLLTDGTGGLTAPTLAIDANGNVVVMPGGQVPGSIGLTPFDFSGVVTPGVGGGTATRTPVPTVDAG